ncbi:MAG: hypothetical protein HN742_38775 [Lentisphaerae bacterium]|jgi:hypothetical protein|nr:hypothetical protein [Lentisphaerota bacterium]MBT4822637.1 hypothetical protein [Lentisphaerota bacterium]MBT5606393.1 hypothetical protein [Lentisphaerota bacterium]MBT7059755.1 hypothetical protein [Lentisphaerota bacterium]MBT7847875.1 hypothetical protein [Lentisphaerota bacterium]
MAKLENEFTWSVSRAKLFEDCPRAYYYQYYGSWGGWERDTDPATRQLYILKNIKTLPMWAGTIVHETIADALNRYSRNNSPIQAGELQAIARQKLRSGWVESVNGEWLQRPKRTNLHELYYGDGKSLPKEQTERTKERVYGALAAFADAQILHEILTVPYMNWKPVDQLDSFRLQDLKVWCAVDFAFTDPAGGLRIIDWKTGGEHREALRVQLACYALYAAEKWFAAIENVKLQGVFLNENARVSTYEVAPDILVEAQDHILSSAADMRGKLLDVAANTAREDDFPCCEKEHICRYCNYREVCPYIG